jgi:hypothetical protein
MSRRDSIAAGVFDFSNATDFEVFTSDNLSSTTITYPNYVDKLVDTSDTTETGRYVVNWYAELTNSGNNNLTWFRVEWKQTASPTWLTLTEIDVLIPRGESFVPVSGFKTIDNLTTSTIDLRIQFARDSGTARIKNTNVYLFRVAV